MSEVGTLQHALSAARAGWHVFPCKPHDKEPATPNGFKDGTTNPASIRARWNGRRYNLGISTGPSGLVVIDIDEGLSAVANTPKVGETSWRELLARAEQDEPHTLTVRTPNGGRHLYFEAPPGVDVKSSNGKLGLDVVTGRTNEQGRKVSDLDVRAEGGYVVGPGSRIGEDAYVVVTSAPVAQLPPWLLDLVTARAPRRLAAPGSTTTQSAPRVRPDQTADDATTRGRVSVPVAPAHPPLDEPDPFDDPANTSGPPEGAPAAGNELAGHLAALIRELAEAPDGVGNDTASRIAYMLGQYVGAEQLDHGYALSLLEYAIADWSFAQPRDHDRMLRTFEAQLAAGALVPRAWISSAAPAPIATSSDELSAVHPWVGDVLSQLRDADDSTRLPLAREIAQRAAGLSDAEALSLRDDVLALSDLTRADWRSLRAAARAAARSAALEDREVIPGPGDPLDVARAFCDRYGTAAPMFWRDDWYVWDREVAVWRIAEPVEMLGAMGRWLAARAYRDENGELKPWRPSPRSCNEVLTMMGAAVRGRHGLDDDEGPLEHMVAMTNGHYDTRTGALHAPDPARFVTRRVAYAFDEAATCPRWEAFVAEVYGEEPAAMLQEWAGYLVSGRNDLERIFSVYGERRSGKGTTVRILTEMLGESAVTAGSLRTFSDRFGPATLIGRSLVLVDEAEWNHRDALMAVAMLKSISGRALQNLDRKNREPWKGVLPTRIMLTSNDPPMFRDPSGAMLGRLLNVRTRGSHYGSEDPQLGDKLATELPGILLWALRGLARLEARGRFGESAESRELAAKIRLTGNPIAAWIDARCTVADNASCSLDVAYADYRAWCEANGEKPVSTQWLSRTLSSMGIGTARTRQNGERVRTLEGLNVLPAAVDAQWL